MSGDQGHYVHPQGLCESEHVGSGTRIWAFAHVLPGAVIGADCNICDGVFIENDVVVGDRVTIKCGVQLWDGIRIDDDVFIGPNATFTNDAHPRSRRRPPRFLETQVHQGASIGANVTILPGLTIGRDAMVGAGAVVSADVPANAKVVGNPARIIGYVGDAQVGYTARSGTEMSDASEAALPAGVRMIELPKHVDLRGSLVVNELEEHLPFTPRRSFLVLNVPSRDVRGEHAHRSCSQFLTCVAGSLRVHLDDGTHRAEVVLDTPVRGLVIPPMVWASQFNYTEDAVLLVLASHPYDPDDYIRDYDTFLSALAGR